MSIIAGGEGQHLAKVMIVDDDQTTVKLLTIFLQLEDFEVVNAMLGNLALERAQQTQPDLFMIDYRLPDTDGLAVIRALRAVKAFASTPIVMSSGMNVEQEALEAGANTFLTKPLEPAELPSLFKRLIAAKP